MVSTKARRKQTRTRTDLPLPPFRSSGQKAVEEEVKIEAPSHSGLGWLNYTPPTPTSQRGVVGGVSRNAQVFFSVRAVGTSPQTATPANSIEGFLAFVGVRVLRYVCQNRLQDLALSKTLGSNPKLAPAILTAVF